MTASERLAELGIVLPEVVPPLAAYVPATQVGDFVYTSGQLPMRDGSSSRRARSARTARASSTSTMRSSRPGSAP